MTLVHDPIDSLIGGVSQQAEALRFKSQAETIENCWLSPIEGLIPRSHTSHQASVITGKQGAMFSHLIDRDRLERYAMLVRQQELLLYDLRGDLYPVRWDGSNLIETPLDPDATPWVVTGAGITSLPGVTAAATPHGDTTNGIDIEIDLNTSGQTLENDIDKIDGAGSNKRTITSGRPYIFWWWMRLEDASALEKTRMEIIGQSSARGTLIEIDWLTTPEPQVSLFTPTGDGRHDHGLIYRGNEWVIGWVVMDWDSTDDSNGFTVRLTPEVNSVASNRTIYFFELMCEEWDPTLEGPSLRWAPDISTSDQGLITNTGYFEFRQSNDITDPESFDDLNDWVLGAGANAAVISAFPNPFAWASPNSDRFYYKLESQAGATKADYEQTVGVIYPGPQVLLCYFRNEDSTAAGVEIQIEDDTSGQRSGIKATWVGDVLTLTAASETGATRDFDVIQSPYDDDDYCLWIAIHPNDHASVTAGNVRKVHVIVDDVDAGATRFTYGWGALLLDGERAAKFLDYMNPLRNVRALTIADSTFLMNPDVAVKKFDLKTPENETDQRAYFFVKKGGYDGEYIIRLIYTDGTTDEVYATTYVGTGTGAAKCIFAHGRTQTACEAEGGTWQPANEEILSSETTEVAAKLSQDLDDISGITSTHKGSVVEVLIASKMLERVEVEDAQGGTALIAIWRDVEKVQDLPIIMRDQFRVRVRGNRGEAEPEYYVMFLVDGESGNLGEGRWVESTYWDTEDLLDHSTLPHQIRRLQDDATGERTGTKNQLYFEVRYAPWPRRLVGDNKSNPFPALVSTPDVDNFIGEVFFFQSRLGFLSGEALTFSEVDRFFNIFRSTVIDANDADAIGATASHTEVSLLRQAIVLDERMVVSSDRTQFIVSGDPILSSKTIQVVKKLGREILRRPHMIDSGRGIFAAYPRRADSDDSFDFSGMLEILPTGSGAQAQLQADEITNAVPAYLEGEVEYMAANASAGIMLVVTDAGRVYVYQYFSSGGQDLQQAWHEWIFGSDKLSFCGLARTEAVFLVRREEGVFLETMRVGENLIDDGSTILTRLDRRIDQDDVTMVYDDTDDETTITLPYNIRTGATMIAVDKSTLISYPTISATALATALVVQGDLTSTDVWIGESYGAAVKYEFSDPFLRTQDAERAVRKLSSGKTTILNGKLVFADTAAFELEIVHRHGDTYDAPYSSFHLDTPDADLDAVVLLDGEHEFGIGGFPEDVTITIKGKGHLPFQILTATWEGQYAPRSAPVPARG